MVGSAGYLEYDDSTTHSTSNGVIGTDRWYHVAATRSGTSLKLFVDGVLKSTHTNSYNNTENGGVTIGREYEYTSNWNGYISNVRIIKGTALYTSGFTVPTAPLTDVTNTKLLCCQSDTSAGAAAVSPSISGVNNGTVWSDDVSGTAYGAGYGAEILFDGSDDYAQSAYPGSLTWTPSGGMAFSSTLELEVYRDGSNALTIVHAGGSTDVSSQITNNQWFKWTVTGITSPITSITWASTGSGNYIAARAIYIDSVELRDPVTAYGDAAATTKSDDATVIDVLADSPTTYDDGGNGVGNYCTWNPLVKFTGVAGINQPTEYSNGNLQAKITTGGTWTPGCGTIAVNSDKWYAEFEVADKGAANHFHVGINPPLDNFSGVTYHSASNSGHWYGSDGQLWNAGSATGAGSYATVNDGDIIGIALDFTASTVTFYKNGSSLAQVSLNSSITTHGAVFAFDLYPTCTVIANFGQRAFDNLPTGFKALNTFNLPDPTIADPSKYFDIATDTGANILSAATALTDGADFVWIKDRANTDDHILFNRINDSGMDGTPHMRSNETDDESTCGTYSAPSGNSVGWVWNAGSSTVSNTDGTITSSVRANTTAGFSIVSYTGNGTAGATVGHGLNAGPDLIIVKNRDTSTGGYWAVRHSSLGSDYLLLDLNNAKNTNTGVWTSTSPTSSVFSVGSSTSVNTSTDGHIAYCWSEIPGFSKFGLWDGNGDPDGPFIELGFRPAVILYKDITSTGFWNIRDSARTTYNGATNELYPATTESENTHSSDRPIDFLSNGFKIRSNSAAINNGSRQYMYAAWAEAPFKYSNAR